MTLAALSLRPMAPRSVRKKDKPAYGLAIAARRKLLNKSGLDVENETNGDIYQKLLYRIEGGTKDPLRLDLKQFIALLSALEWTPQQFAEETGLPLPRHFYQPPEGPTEPIERYRVDPQMEYFTVYPGLSAGTGPGEPIGREAAIPKDLMLKEAITRKDVTVIKVDDDCLISQHLFNEKIIRRGDLLAVRFDRGRRPYAIAVSYLANRDKLAIYADPNPDRADRPRDRSMVFEQLAPSGPILIAPNELEVTPRGYVFWRSGGL